MDTLYITWQPQTEGYRLWLILYETNLRAWHWQVKGLPSFLSALPGQLWRAESIDSRPEEPCLPLGYHLAILPLLETGCACFLLALANTLHLRTKFVTHFKEIFVSHQSEIDFTAPASSSLPTNWPPSFEIFTCFDVNSYLKPLGIFYGWYLQVMVSLRTSMSASLEQLVLFVCLFVGGGSFPGLSQRNFAYSM